MDYIYPNLPSRCTWRLDAKPEDSVHCHQPKFEKQPKVLPNILHAVGNTPLIRLNKIPKEYGIKCEMYAKCEFFNPGGSVKDRVALRMIEEAERNGKVKPGAVFIEPTTGNTGIAMALAAAIKGYSCINVVPEHISAEKMTVMRALGAEIIRTPRTALIRDENSLHRIAQKLSETIPDSIVLDQCRNPENPLVHYDTTAEEIIDQLDGNIDMIVLGAGTGATVSGLGRKFKEKVPTCKVVVCDPYGHAFAKPENLENGVLATCEIESVGLTFYSTVLDVTVVDEWVETTDKEAFQMARSIIRKEGLLCGESSGSVLCAALKAAKDLKEGQKCVLLFGDGVRNSMTRLLNDDWLASRGFIDINPEMAEKHWWWNLKVSSLSLATPSSISPNVYCQNAIARMKKKASDILIVVDDTGKIKGVVTLKSMMSRIMTKKLTSSTKVSEILDTNHREITTDTSLGQLSRILSQEGFALVVDKHKQCLSKTDDGKHMLAAVVKQIDLVDFIVNKNKMTLPINSYEKVENDKSQLDIEICSLGP